MDESIKKKLKDALSFEEHSVILQLANEYLKGEVPLSVEERANFHRLLSTWLHHQREEAREIGKTLIEVLERLNLNNSKIRKRMESFEYLRLVRKSFRNWSVSESDEKRNMVRNMLVNAAILKLSPDHVISMFIDWIDKYSDAHFKILKEISKHPGITRKKIWLKLYKELPPEDSAEADLYKLLILDLSTGHIIRQRREKDYYGKFVKPQHIEKSESVYKTTQFISAFDDERQYDLTELGKQFTHYTMSEKAPLEKTPECHIYYH